MLDIFRYWNGEKGRECAGWRKPFVRQSYLIVNYLFGWLSTEAPKSYKEGKKPRKNGVLVFYTHHILGTGKR